MYKRVGLVLLCLVMGLAVVGSLTSAAQDVQSDLNSPQIVEENSISIVNQVGGAVQGVTVSGTHAYVSRGPRLQVYDLSQPMEPELVGQTAVLPRVLHYTDIAGHTVFAASTRNIAVIDVSNPQSPVINQVLPVTGTVGNVAVKGNYLFAVQESYGSPASGLHVYKHNGTQIISETAFLPMNESYLNFTIHGDYLYVVGDDSPNATLRVINIVDPENPIEVNSIYRGYYVSNKVGVTVDGDYLYTGAYDDNSGGDLLLIYNISNPVSPSFVSLHSGPFLVRAVEIVNGLAYVAGSSGGFRLIDVSNPDTPIDVDDYKTDVPGVVFAVDLEKVNDSVYLAYETMGLHVLDVSQSDAVTVTMVANEVGVAYGITQAKNHLYVADYHDGFKIFSGSGASDLYLENSVNPGFASSSNLSFVDDSVFAEARTFYFSSPSLVKLSTTAVLTPAVADSFEPDGYLETYVVKDEIAFIAADDKGLQNIDFSVSPPIKLGEWITTSSAFDVAVAGNYAYLADYSNGLKVIDISNPLAPFAAGFLELEWIQSIETYGDYAYAVSKSPATGDFLHVIDISNPVSPTLLLSLPHSTSLSTLTIKSDKLYMGRWLDDFTRTSSGVLGYDISNPASPTLLFDIDLPGWIIQIEEVPPYIYVASSLAGVVVLGPDVEFDEYVYLPVVVK